MAARYVYDDGTEQIARDELFDRTLDSICTPTQFSDGNRYCQPRAQEGFYTDEHCTRAMGRVPNGKAPPGYLVTTYGINTSTQPSRVYRTGARAEVPTHYWKRYEDGCAAFPIESGFDYYEAGEQIDMARVSLDAWFHVGDYVVDTWTREDGLRVATSLENCALPDRPNQPTIDCVAHPEATYVMYANADCSTPIMVGYSDVVNSLHDDNTDCTSYFVSGEEVPPPPALFQRVGSTCVMSGLPTGALHFSATVPTDVPRLMRSPVGDTRIQLIHLSGLPLLDHFVHDTLLATDCRRDADGRCLPATDAKVETWFSDALCGTAIDVAMVRTGGCNAAVGYAERDGVFYPVHETYGGQLYQLNTGDTCSPYAPPEPFVAHSIGEALGDEAFARATLVTE